jgi:hypothetical protein
MSSREATPSPASGERSLSVLLVDDQAIVGASVRQMLAGEPDITLHFCQDPAKAIGTIRVHLGGRISMGELGTRRAGPPPGARRRGSVRGTPIRLPGLRPTNRVRPRPVRLAPGDRARRRRRDPAAPLQRRPLRGLWSGASSTGRAGAGGGRQREAVMARVLVIDDQPFVLDVLRRLLEGEGR